MSELIDAGDAHARFPLIHFPGWDPANDGLKAGWHHAGAVIDDPDAPAAPEQHIVDGLAGWWSGAPRAAATASSLARSPAGASPPGPSRSSGPEPVARPGNS